MNNSKLTAIVYSFYTRCSKVDHYRVGRSICIRDGANAGAELRRYYALAKKIRANDDFGQAALDAVDWASIAGIFTEAVAA